MDITKNEAKKRLCSILEKIAKSFEAELNLDITHYTLREGFDSLDMVISYTLLELEAIEREKKVLQKKLKDSR